MMSSSSSVQDNLNVVDEAYGATADLYGTVLRVQSNASSEQIQSAFLQRRRDLFQRLELGQAVEKQMDAVVLAARILGDPDTRLQYDDIRSERIAAAAAKNKDTKNTSYEMSIDDNRNPKQQQQSSPDRSLASTATDSLLPVSSRRLRSSHAPRVVSPDQPLRSSNSSNHHNNNNQSLNETLETTIWDDDETATLDDTLNDTIDQSTVMSTSIIEPPKSLLDRVHDEIMGAVEDTSKSLEDVFSVFTLQEEDIKAVMGRIDKAKRQMERSI